MLYSAHRGQHALMVQRKERGEDLFARQVPRGAHHHDRQRAAVPVLRLQAVRLSTACYAVKLLLLAPLRPCGQLCPSAMLLRMKHGCGTVRWPTLRLLCSLQGEQECACCAPAWRVAHRKVAGVGGISGRQQRRHGRRHAVGAALICNTIHNWTPTHHCAHIDTTNLTRRTVQLHAWQPSST